MIPGNHRAMPAILVVSHKPPREAGRRPAGQARQHSEGLDLPAGSDYIEC